VSNSEPLLSVADLRIGFPTHEGRVLAVDGVSFDIWPHETLGIVGESGSGKSVTALSLLKMVPAPGVVDGGEIRFRGRNLNSMTDRELRNVRGTAIAMIFQDPSSSLNPVVQIGTQVAETVRAHQKLPAHLAEQKACEMLRQVGIPDPDARMREYPYQMSGGMRQRVMIAMALVNDPEILIADEPTTALDVTIQAQILDLLESINHRLGTATVLISHNMGVIGRLCPRAIVMYAGKIVEEGPTDQLFRAPAHPYTWGLLQAIPRLDKPHEEGLFSIPGRPADPLHRPRGCPFVDRCAFTIERCRSEMPPLVELAQRQRSACWATQAGLTLPPLDSLVPRENLGLLVRRRPAPKGQAGPLLELRDVTKHFPAGRRFFPRSGERDVIHAVEGVSLSVNGGETVGLVGESGCGKSTLGRTVVHAFAPTSGSIRINGVDTAQMTDRQFRPFRRHIQMIFQDPYSSLNPRMTVEQIIGEPLIVHGLADRPSFVGRIDELLERVGLTPRARPRYPREFSGGQRQRIAIARALAVNPGLIVCDEPVSSLDVSLQAQVVNLLKELQRELGVAYIFIAHDLAVVRNVSDRIAVMYLGKIVELGDSSELVDHPLHPYTSSLLSAVFVPETASSNRDRIVLRGDLPSPRFPPTGCRFHTRCPIGPANNPERTVCAVKDPPLVEHSTGHSVACHFPGELTSTLPSNGDEAVPVA
jgi:peptide/nickel transport system ATP-binding protein